MKSQLDKPFITVGIGAPSSPNFLATGSVQVVFSCLPSCVRSARVRMPLSVSRYSLVRSLAISPCLSSSFMW